MSHEIAEIHSAMKAQQAHIGATFQPVEQPADGDSLEKSHIIDAFTYGENKMFIQKTGAEIKAAITVAKQTHEAQLAQLKAAADAWLGQCGENVPTEEMYSDYKTGPTDVLPKTFSWRVVEALDKNTKSATTGGVVVDATTTTPAEPAINCMDKYNDTIRAWCRLRKEISMIQTIISGLDEKKTYQLTLAQANAIGL